MANFELQIEVAMALGWDGFWYAPGVTFAWPPGATIEDDRMPLPDWPNDWNAAMELVKIAQDRGVGVGIVNYIEPPFDSNEKEWGWDVTFFDPVEGPISKDYQAYSSFGPTAICKAFLKWWKGASDGTES